MDIENFINNFAAQFDDTDSSVFTAQTRFRDLDEWSSLFALSIIAMIDEIYEAKVKGEDIRNSETIEDLFKIVQSRK